MLQGVRVNPSSGAVSIGLLEDDPDVSRIDVFGMNFQFQYGLAHSRHERQVVARCCTKCRIHPTRSAFYFPLRTLDARWMLQFMGIYLTPLVAAAALLVAGCAIGLARRWHAGAWVSAWATRTCNWPLGIHRAQDRRSTPSSMRLVARSEHAIPKKYTPPGTTPIWCSLGDAAPPGPPAHCREASRSASANSGCSASASA